jgi:hypothetical protein
MQGRSIRGTATPASIPRAGRLTGLPVGSIGAPSRMARRGSEPLIRSANAANQWA